LQVTLRDVAVAEQRAVEIQRIRARLFDRLLFGVRDVDVRLDDQVVGRDAMAVSIELARVKTDHVLADARMAALAGCDR
jgi:hypothetical protein